MNTNWARWLSRLLKQSARTRREKTRRPGRLILEALEERLAPATNVWIGLTDANWATASNWSLGRVPQNGDDLTFGTTTGTKNTNINLANLTLNSITFSASSYLLSGNPITVSAGITLSPGASGEEIRAIVNFPGSAAITVNSAADLTISREVTSPASGTITKRGEGTLILGASSPNLLGPIDIQAGPLAITNAGALGDTAVATTVEPNAQLQLRNVTGGAVNESLLLNGSGISGDGALLNAAGNTTWAGTIRMDSDSSIGASSTTVLTISGLISDSGFTGGHDLTKVGTGQIIFSRIGGNTYRGLTTIEDGILTIQDPLSLGAGADATKPQNGTPQSGVVVLFNSTTGEAGSLQLDFTGTLGANDPNGILQNPSLPFNATTNPYVGFQVFNDLLTLNGPGFNNNGALTNSRGRNEWSGDVTLTSPLAVGGSVNVGVAANSQLIVSGVVSDTSATPTLAKILPGRLVLNNTNTYRNLTTVSAGSLNIRDSRALGAISSPAPANASTTVASGAALELEVDSGLDGTPARNRNRNLGFDTTTRTGSGQEVVVNGTAGTFRLTLNGQTTGILDAASATLAADIRAALGALGTVGGAANITVTQTANIYRVLFVAGPLLNANVPLIVPTVISGTPNVLINPIYGLTVAEPLTLNGTGLAATPGALRSISGFNQYTGSISVGTGAVSVGVELDARPGHPLADNTYFTDDHSLTIPGSFGFGTATTFTKDGAGHLILPVANNSISGQTRIRQGWITIRNNASLGPATISNTLGETAQPNVITVEAGGSLHLKPTAAGVDMTLANRLILLGGGQGITHPFSLINQKGAVVSTGGNNTLSNIIQLGGSVGIGIETLSPSTSGQLTLTGWLEDATGTTGGIIKHGSQPLIIQAPGAYSGAVLVTQGTLRVQNDLALGRGSSGTAAGTQTYTQSTTTVAAGALLELLPGLTTFHGGIQAGNQTWNESLVLNGAAQLIALSGSRGRFSLTFGGQTTVTPLDVTSATLAADVQAALNALANVGPAGASVSVTRSGNLLTVVFGGTLAGLINPLISWNNLNTPGNNLDLRITGTPYPLSVLSDDNLWHGPVTLGANTTLDIADNARLIIEGTIDDATNPAGSSLTVGQVGTGRTGELVLAGASTYRGTTTVAQGLLTVADGQALGSPGSPEIQTLTLSGATTGSFTLSFDGFTTDPLLHPLNVESPTLAADVRNALNALRSIGGVGGSVSVTRSANVLTVTFDGGSFVGQDQLPLMATPISPGVVVDVNTDRNGFGGTIVTNGAQIQIRGNLTVAGESLILQGTGVDPANLPTSIPFRWFEVGPSPINNGQTPGNQAVTGRVTGVVVDPSDSNVVYLTSAGGGAWKTINGGRTWTQLFDSATVLRLMVPATTGTGQFTLTFNGQTTAPLNLNGLSAAQIQAALNNLTSIGGLTPVAGSVRVTQSSLNTIGGLAYNIAFGGALSGSNQPVLTATGLGTTPNPVITSVRGTNILPIATHAGAIAIDPTNPRILYLGTGDTSNSNDAFFGTGVYKSIDSGRTWTLLTDSDGNNPLYGLAISKIVLDTASPGRIYVAASDEATNNPVGTGVPGVYRYDETAPRVQTIVLPTLTGTGTFTLTYQSPIAQNNDPVSVLTVGGTGQLPFPSGTTVAINVNSATLAQDVQTALNNLTAISGLDFPGRAVVTQSAVNPQVLYVSFDRSLIGATPALMTATGTGITNPVVSNSSLWVNLTASATFTRRANGTGVPTTQTSTDPRANPDPGPNDDYRFRFLQSNVTWSDLSLSGGILYATQSRDVGTTHGATFWTELPLLAATAAFPTPWHVGNPGAQEVQRITITNPNGGGQYTLAFAGNPATGTTLAANIDAVQTTITVTNGNRFPATGPFAVLIDTEVFEVTAGFGTNSWTVTRGFHGSTAATHNAAVAVSPATYRTLNANTDARPNTTNTNYFVGEEAWTIQNELNKLVTIGEREGIVSVVINAASTFAAPGTLVLDVTFLNDMKYIDMPNLVVVPVGFATNGGIAISSVSAGTGPDNRSATEFPGGNFVAGGIARNGQIKMSASGLTAYAVVAIPDNNPNYPSNRGSLLEIRRTADGGKTWATVTMPANFLANTGWYDLTVLTTNGTIVYVGGASQILRSTDSGATWTDISVDANGMGPHGAHHALAADAQGRLLSGNDGGLWRYDPATGLWTDLNGDLTITQFNGIASHPFDPDVILGSSQGNGLERFTGDLAWRAIDQGEGGEVRYDPVRPNVIYSSQTGVLRRSFDGGQTWTSVLTVNPSPTFPPTTSPITRPGHTPFFPFVIDPLATSRILVGSGPGNSTGTVGLQESMNQGTIFRNLNSPIATVTSLAIATYQGNLPNGTYQLDPGFTNVPDKGASTYDPDTIYVANSNSVFVTKNHGQNWVDRTPGLAGGSIVAILVDPRNRDTIYALTQGAPQSGSNRLLVSTNAGRTWTNVTGTGADRLIDMPVWSMVLDPRATAGAPNGRLYVGTDNGVWTAAVGSTSWSRLGNGMPQVQVKSLDLNIKLNTLTAGTYGRSAYQFYLEDLLPNSGALRVLSGTSSWLGPIRFADDTTVTVNGVQTVPNGSANAQLDVVGPISDLTAGANYAFTKDGQGTLVLSGANTYGGLTDVLSGVVLVNDPLALGTSNPAGADIVAQGGTRIATGAALELQSDLQGEPVLLNGVGISPGLNGHNTGAMRNVSGQNTYTGTLTLNTNTTIGVDSGTQLTIGSKAGLTGTGTIVGTFDLIKELTGTLVLGSDNATFAGATTVNQGALRVADSGALGTGTVATRVLDGAQIQTQSPAGGPAVVVDKDLFLSGTGIFGTGALLNAGGDNVWAGDVTLASLPGFSPFTTPNGTVAFGVSNQTDTLSITGQITEAANIPSGLAKVGPGALALANANTYSGATYVFQGSVTVQDVAALGNRASTVPSVQRITTLSDTGTGTFVLRFNGNTSAALTFGASQALVLSTLNSAPLNANVASVTRAAISTVNQAGVTLNGFVYTVVFNTATSIPLIALGTDPTVASASVVADGGIDVLVANLAALEIDSTPSSTPAGFTVAPHRLTLNGRGPTGEGALHNVGGNNTWPGAITLATDSAIGADASTSLRLTGGVSAGSLSVVDPGTVIFPVLAGGLTFAQVLTTVEDGNAQVDGTIGDVLLDGGALSGTGTVGVIASTGSSRINTGVNFPTDSIGTLTSAGGTLSASDLFFVDLGNPATSATDLLRVTGTLELGSANLDGLLLAPNAFGDVPIGSTYTIITGPVTGQFAGRSTTPVAGGLSATVAFINGHKFVVDYFADKVVITRTLLDVGLTLTAALDSPLYGQIETFTVTFAPEVQPPSPTGTVVFHVTDPSGATTQFPVPIVVDTMTGNSSATWDPVAQTGNPLSIGLYTVFVTYNGLSSNGGPTFQPSASNPVAVTVTAAPTTTVLSPVSPAPYGQNITFTATVASTITPQAGNTQPPTGTVSFFDGTTLLGMGTLSTTAGVTTATFQTSSLAMALTPGNHPISAVYNSDGVPDNYLGSTSAPRTQVINKANTTTMVVSGTNPSVFGQQVTFTATVTPATAFGNPPTGAVTFRLGAAVLGTGTLSTTGGVTTATYTTTPFQLPVNAALSVTASYAGDTNYNLSNSSAITQTVNKADTTIAVSSSSDPSVFGQQVTFTATVSASAPGSGNPGGTVQFFLGTGASQVLLGSGTLSVVGGVVRATYTTTPQQLPVGAGQVITASYLGSGNYNPSTSAPITQTVTTADTTTVVSSSSNPSVFGQQVTFTATVSPNAPSSGSPTGTVTFVVGATVLGNGTLSTAGGLTTATYTTTAFQLPVGAGQVITATYAGDGNYNGSDGMISQTVNPASTTTLVASSANPSVFGQQVTFTATVSASSPGSGNPTGTVTFMLGATTLGSGTLSTAGGVTTASFTTTAFQLAVGPNQVITASYSGDSNYDPSSGIISQTVNRADTTTTVASSVNPSVFGQPVTFTATVSSNAPGSGNPGGTVTFMLGATVLGSGTLSTAGGVTTATYTTTAFQLPVGSAQTVTANYSGNGNYNPSSGPISQTVNPAQTTTTVASSVNPSVFGQQVTFTATVSANAPGSGDPTGTVRFMLGATVLGSGTLSTAGGLTTASYTTTATQLPVGANQVITANYLGSVNYVSSSGTVNQTVNKADTTTDASVSPSPSVFGQQVTFTALISANAPGSGDPTGIVTFMLGATPLGAGTLSTTGGVTTASYTTSAFQLPVGVNQTITANYSGDGSYNPSSDVLTTTVQQAQTMTAVNVTPNSPPNAPAFGQSITFTTTVTAVAPGSGVPTGSVSFLLDGAPVTLNPGQGLLNGSGQVTFNRSNLSVGMHTISATYAGDTNYLGSLAGSQTFQVFESFTNVLVTANPSSPSVFGQQVDFTATVTGVTSSVTPTGRVTFYDDRNNDNVGTPDEQIGTTQTLAGGQATVSTSGLSRAAHRIIATYDGSTDPNFRDGNGSLAYTVNRADTTVTVTVPPAPQVNLPGQTFTVSAQVQATAPGAGIPTGTVTFRFNGGAGRTMTLDATGTATLNVNDLDAGTYTVTATYDGNATPGLDNFNPSATQAPQQSVTVTQATTTTNLVSSAPPSVLLNTPVTFTATVTRQPGANLPLTGTVTFVAQNQTTGANVTLGTAALNASGVAAITTGSAGVPHPAPGTYLIIADYNPTTNYATSRGTTGLMVTAFASATTVDALPQNLVNGQAVTLTARVAGTGPGSGQAPANGTVTFLVDGNPAGTVNVQAGGIATLGPIPLAVGAHQIRAVFNGTPTFTPSTSAVATTTVGAAPTAVTSISVPGPINVRRPVTITATVAAVAPGSGVPTGTVVFRVDGAVVGQATINAAGQAMINYTPTAANGSHPLVAEYTGSAAFQPSSASSTLTVTPYVDQIYAVGAGLGSIPAVKVYDALTGAERFSFFAYDTTYVGGVRVAVADVTGDGFSDVICGTTPGAPGAHVVVFDGVTGQRVRSFFSIPGFTNGIFVGGGDVDGDGFADVMVGTDAGVQGRILIFSGRTGAMLSDNTDVFANFAGGVRVAGGDVDGDGFADVIAGSGFGSTPHVKVFSGQGNALIRSFFAYDAAFRGGVFVAAGNLDGDRFADVITGAGTVPHVKSFSGQSLGLQTSFIAADRTGGPLIGGPIGAVDRTGDGITELLVTFAGAPTSQLRTLDPFSAALANTTFVFPGFQGDIFVG